MQGRPGCPPWPYQSCTFGFSCVSWHDLGCSKTIYLNFIHQCRRSWNFLFLILSPIWIGICNSNMFLFRCSSNYGYHKFVKFIHQKINKFVKFQHSMKFVGFNFQFSRWQKGILSFCQLWNKIPMPFFCFFFFHQNPVMIDGLQIPSS